MELLTFIGCICIIILITNIFIILINNSKQFVFKIPNYDIEILKLIRTKFYSLFYITNYYEYNIIGIMLDNILSDYYPKIGCSKPYETWIILARQYYKKYKKIVDDKNDIIDYDNIYDILEYRDNIIATLKEIIILSKKVKSIEIMPCCIHIWLCCWIRIIYYYTIIDE